MRFTYRDSCRDVLVEQLKDHFTNCTKWDSPKKITDSCLSLPSYFTQANH